MKSMFAEILRSNTLSRLRVFSAVLFFFAAATVAQAADLTGKWTGVNQTITVYCDVPPTSSGPAEIEIAQTGDTFTGTYLFTFENPETCIPATELSSYVLDLTGTVSGDSFTAEVSFPGQGPLGTMNGSVTGNAMAFTWIIPTDEDHDDPTELIDSIVTGQLARVPPSVVPSAAVTALWPPNNTMADIGLTVGVTDYTGTAETTFIVYSDEDDGRTADASGSLLLRAERNGTGDGRVYLIAVTTADAFGNTSHGCLTAVVPKSQSASDLASVDAQAAAALAQCPSAPAEYFVIER